MANDKPPRAETEGHVRSIPATAGIDVGVSAHGMVRLAQQYQPQFDEDVICIPVDQAATVARWITEVAAEIQAGVWGAFEPELEPDPQADIETEPGSNLGF